MRVRVLHHHHCFDGAAAAAFFTRFVEEKFYPGAEFAYTGMVHEPNQKFADSLFDGDVNAIVDFKYAANPKLTWWFDHHESAFLSQEDMDYFTQAAAPWHFLDPKFRSCTKYIDYIARERFGFTAPDLAELVQWADIIDGAQYANAQEAVEIHEPPTQLVLVIESAKAQGIVEKIIRMMQSQSLAAIAADPDVRGLFEPLYQQHLSTIDTIRRLSHSERGVVFFDLVDSRLEGYNKFIPYYLHPESIYTVSILENGTRTKISVGSNPWVDGEIQHNLARICERYGGGGHPRVGAISLPKGATDEARRVATEIVRELQS